MSLRQVALSKGDEFIAQHGIVFDASTDTYVRLRRTDTLRFDGTPRKRHAHIGAVQLTWIDAEWPDLRQRITDWWMNRKEPA